MKAIQVTEPFLPPLEEYVEYLKGIWDRKHLSNNGPLVKEFEHKIQTHHRIDMPVYCVTNGGLGLQVMLKALGVSGEVITTPFSYVATASCPLWEGCSVQFADIEPDYLTIDPVAVEAAVGPDTEAILATHVFGNPCDCDALEAIASKHGLALIFDAAHAFGVRYKDKSILEYGDASMVSLHATKLMHSVEGGFVVVKDPSVAEKVEWMRCFGHKGYDAFHGVGINAKMSELHAAMGLCNMGHLEEISEKRKAVCGAYDQAFLNSEAAGVLPFAYRRGASLNHSYYPVVFDSEGSLLSAVERCNKANIFPRRYFYPDLSSCFGDDHETCPLAIDISQRILCLPLAASMEPADATSVAKTICGND